MVISIEDLSIIYLVKNTQNYITIFDVTVTILFDYLLKASWIFDKMDSSIIWFDDFFFGYSNGIKKELENYKLKELDYNKLNPNDLLYNRYPPSYITEGFFLVLKKN